MYRIGVVVLLIYLIHYVFLITEDEHVQVFNMITETKTIFHVIAGEN